MQASPNAPLMAVTQQLARLTGERLAECRRSVDALDQLCQPEVRTGGELLDLDWSPQGLRGVAAAVSDELAGAVADACAGGDEINPRYADRPNSIWEHPVRALEPDAVVHVSAILSRWTWGRIAIVLPVEPEEAKRMTGLEGLVVHPAVYLGKYYAALRWFYAEAAAHSMAVATWWD